MFPGVLERKPAEEGQEIETDMADSLVRENLRIVRDRICLAAETAGRSGDDVRLVAVSKSRPVDLIIQAYQCGHKFFGENRVWELESKTSLLPADCEWHLIGHLQKNKVRAAVKNAAWIHSVDSSALISRIDRIAEEEQKRPVVLLQLNVSGETAKFGVARDNARDLCDAAANCSNVDWHCLKSYPWHQLPLSLVLELIV